MREGRRFWALLAALLLLCLPVLPMAAGSARAEMEVPVAVDAKKEASQPEPQEESGMKETDMEETDIEETGMEETGMEETGMEGTTEAQKRTDGTALETPETEFAQEADGENSTPPPQTAEPTLVPEEIREEAMEVLPSATLEAAVDATLEPDAPLEPAVGVVLMQRIGAQEYNRLNPSRLDIPDTGMAIPRIYQYDYRETVCRFGEEDKSVATSGCGAAAASMLIAYLTENYDQTPYTLFYRAVERGEYCGDGLSFSTVRKLLSSHGVRSRMEGVSAQGIREALDAGQPIILLMGPGAFTREGHYIVLRGIDENGQVMVNDPASSARSEQRYSLNLLLSEAKGDEMLVALTERKQRQTATPSEPAQTPEEIVAMPTAAVPDAAGYRAVVCVECVNLRAEIGTQGEIVLQLSQGAELWVLEECALASGNVWCRVNCQERELYVRRDMLERVD